MTRELSNGINLKGPLQLSDSAGTSGQVLTSAGAGAVPTWAPAGGFTGGTLTSNLTLASGTTSLSPLRFQSGTNLTTATAGAIEYDGKVIYSTPASRGVSPSMMFYRLNSDLAGANVTTAQKLFGVGVTLAANTIYAFEMVFTLEKTTGTASHGVSIGFDGGTATINNIHVSGTYSNLQGAPPTSSNLVTSSWFYGTHNSLAQLNYVSGVTGPIRTQTGVFMGTVSINAGGTFIPQYQLSALPVGPYSTLAGSYFAIWPIGAAGANTSVGPWA